MLYFPQLLGNNKKKEDQNFFDSWLVELISVVMISLEIVELDDIMDKPTAAKPCLTLSPTFHQKELASAQIHKRGYIEVQLIL